MNILPVILSGGSGTRLWPLSRASYPKHLIPLLDDQSLLQRTVLRLEGLAHCLAPLLICAEKQRFMVAEQLQQIGVTPAAIILEPVARNTAPAVAIAAEWALANVSEDCLLLILPADHVIEDVDAFQRVVTTASQSAQQGHLVTFGIVPNQPHTGYGYIQQGQANQSGGFEVAAFVEKPDKVNAQAYLDSGDYSWNSGMFLMTAECYRQELQHYEPDMVASCYQALQQAKVDLDFLRLNEDAFGVCRNESIDYAVMERTDKACVFPLQAGWNDVGAWDSVQAISPKDQDGNVMVGDVVAEQTSNCYLRTDGRTLAVLGLDNHVVIDTADATLVAEKSALQQVKAIVKQLETKGHRDLLQHHRRQYRPWGWHELMVEGEHFEVRRVLVKAGCAIAKQRHEKRSEHWVVVDGEATVLCDEQTLLLPANESFFIAPGQVHQLANHSQQDLVVIEVQVGECLKADDIVRV